MPTAEADVILDDRLLIEELLVGLPTPGHRHTTMYWYFRASRAAVVGAGGHLAGPFAQLGNEEQNAAIASLLTLRDDIGLPEPRRVVPVMAELSSRYPKLSILSLEATAATIVLEATLLLSEKASLGVLPDVLDAEELPWRVVEL